MVGVVEREADHEKNNYWEEGMRGGLGRYEGSESDFTLLLLPAEGQPF